jgi:hypothetical protein
VDARRGTPRKYVKSRNAYHGCRSAFTRTALYRRAALFGAHLSDIRKVYHFEFFSSLFRDLHLFQHKKKFYRKTIVRVYAIIRKKKGLGGCVFFHSALFVFPRKPLCVNIRKNLREIGSLKGTRGPKYSTAHNRCSPRKMQNVYGNVFLCARLRATARVCAQPLVAYFIRSRL